MSDKNCGKNDPLEVELESYYRRHGVWYRFIFKSDTIHTSDAAKAAGIELSRVTKSLVAQTENGEYVLLIIPGDQRVDLVLAAKAMG